jgi:hypothetical protein
VKILTRENRRFVNKTDRISKRVLSVKRTFAPGAALDFGLNPFAAGRKRPLVRRFQIVDCKVYMIGIGLCIFAIAVGSGIEARQDRPPAIEIMPAGRNPLALGA